MSNTVEARGISAYLLGVIVMFLFVRVDAATI